MKSSFSDIKDISIADQVKKLHQEAVRSAQTLFRDGDFTNPYCNKESIPYCDDFVRKGQAEIYEREIQRLLKEKLCPCCGQSVMGDVDF